MKLATALLMLLIATGVCSSKKSFGQSGAVDVSGSWQAWFCPQRAALPDPEKCSSFALELFQYGDRICGSHSFATPRGARLDEGGAPSIRGKANGDTGTLSIDSSRFEGQLHAEVKRNGSQLHWRRTNDPPGGYLIPESATLSRVKQGAALSLDFVEQLRRTCSSQPNSGVQPTPENGRG